MSAFKTKNGFILIICGINNYNIKGNLLTRAEKMNFSQELKKKKNMIKNKAYLRCFRTQRTVAYL